jgi:hypothetical protein
MRLREIMTEPPGSIFPDTSIVEARAATCTARIDHRVTNEAVSPGN